MNVVCMSDTHLRHMVYPIEVPDGDVLVHAGDATFQGNRYEIKQFSAWFGALPHRHKIFVAGNHDCGFQSNPKDARSLLPHGVHYLEDSGCEIDGVKFWGSPWQPEFFNWAFNLPRGPALKAHWDLIPDDTDVLITHSPPYGIGDWTARGENVGCEDMRRALHRVQPKLHVFGHIHSAFGVYSLGATKCVNASLCNERYIPVNPPPVVEL